MKEIKEKNKMKYRKKPVIFVESTFLLTTPEGILAINADDWVIRGVQGELYPIKPDIFEMTYEKVED